MKRRTGIVVVALGLAATALASPLALKTTEMGRGPTVLLLHSMGGTRNTWMPTVKKLLGGYHVVLADLPGHGGSPLPEPFSLDAAAEQVAATLATLKAESTVVVGQGMGGVLALKALVAHPERARGLVLVDASLVGSLAATDQQRSTFLSFLDANYDMFLKTAFGRMGRDSLQNVQIHAQAAQVPPPVVKDFFVALMTLDGTRDIKALRLPILALGTERIWPADQDSAAFAARMGYAGARELSLKRIANAGFLVASDQPDTLAALVAAFTTRAIARK